jgi:hypothetical protein
VRGKDGKQRASTVPGRIDIDIEKITDRKFRSCPGQMRIDSHEG